MLGSQNNKYVTVNDANAEIDAKLTESIAYEFESGGGQEIDVAAADARRCLNMTVTDNVAFTGSFPTKNTLTFPSIKTGLVSIRNDAGRQLSVKTSSQANAENVIINSYQRAAVFCDGADVRRIDSELHCEQFFPGVPGASVVLFMFVAPRDCRLYDDTTGSATDATTWQGFAQTAPSSNLVCTVYVNTTNVGTVTYLSSGGTMSVQLNPSGDFESVGSGDRVRVVAPGSIPGSPSDLGISMVFGM